MKIYHTFDEYKEEKGLFLTIGFFDGFHIGHQKIFTLVTSDAKLEGFHAGVITFPHHPFKLSNLRGEEFPITTSPQKLKYFEELGTNYTFLVDFTPEIRDMEATQFLEKILLKKLTVKKIYIGEDFRFGKNKKGNVELLKKEGRAFGFSVIVVPPVKINGEIVSSSRIREFIKEGNFNKLKNFLGRRYSIRGNVIKGKGISRHIEYPTANIKIPPILIPSEGVYVGWGRVNNTIYKSAFFLTTRPERIIEAHFIDFKENLYEKDIEIILLKRIRLPMVFKTREEAQRQIAKDVKSAKKLLEEASP